MPGAEGEVMALTHLCDEDNQLLPSIPAALTHSLMCHHIVSR